MQRSPERGIGLIVCTAHNYKPQLKQRPTKWVFDLLLEHAD
jgi:hypothetical protein